MALSNFSFACIGGSFAHRLLADGKLAGSRLGTRKTPFGVSQPIYLCEHGAGRFYLLLRHADAAAPLASAFANHRANIFALKELGVSHIVAWSAARAVSHNYRIGQFVLPDDLIDETRHRAATFFEHGVTPDLRQWPVFCPTLRAGLADTLGQLGFKFSETGTYLCGEGPRQETRAEVRKYALWGADLVGHSLAPEAFLARELQVCYAGLCFIRDFAETGSVHRPYEADSLFKNLTFQDSGQRTGETLERIPAVLEALHALLPNVQCRCTCPAQMDEFIESGLLARDFHDWFQTNPPARNQGSQGQFTPLPAPAFTDRATRPVSTS